jgi:hypothetical protein
MRALPARFLRQPGFTPERYVSMLQETTSQARFTRIYKDGLWLNALNPSESRSGSGSTLASTAVFRAGLEKFLAERAPLTLFDAPCGDFNYMRHVKFPDGVRYIGGDIVPELVAALRRKYPDFRFVDFDITRDKFPECDIWLCRDCLFHLSYADIRKALENFVRSSARYALITNHLNVKENSDIVTGDFRFLDLTLPPVSLPAPQLSLHDLPVDGEPRIVGLWSKEQIRDALANDRDFRPVAAARQ